MKVTKKMIIVSLCLLLVGGMLWTAGVKEQTTATSNVPKIAEGVKYPIRGLAWQIKTDVRAKKPYEIAIVVKNTVNPYMIGQARGMTLAGEAMGFKGLELAPGKPDSADEQAQIIYDLVSRGVDGIAIHPIDSVALVPACEAAMDAGIPVVNIGTLLATDNKLGHLGTAYYHTGLWIAEWVAEKLGGKGNIVNFTGPPEAQNAYERNMGIHDALAKYPDIKIIAEQPTHFRRADAYAAMETILERWGGQIDAVIGANDESAMGGLTALEAAGYDPKDVIIAGFDANRDFTNAILEGRADVTFNSDPPSSSWLAAAYIIDYLDNGNPMPKDYVIYPTLEEAGSIVTQENVKDFLKNAWWDVK